MSYEPTKVFCETSVTNIFENFDQLLRTYVTSYEGYKSAHERSITSVSFI